MDAKTARTLNIREWVSAEGGPAAFSAAFGGRWSPTQVSQWISETNPKGIGHALARALEKAGGKSPGWLDQAHGTGNMNPSEKSGPQSRPVILDAAILAQAYLLAYQEAGVELGVPYKLENDPERTVRAYEFLTTGSPAASDIAVYMAAAHERREQKSGGTSGRSIKARRDRHRKH